MIAQQIKVKTLVDMQTKAYYWLLFYILSSNTQFEDMAASDNWFCWEGARMARRVFIAWEADAWTVGGGSFWQDKVVVEVVL